MLVQGRVPGPAFCFQRGRVYPKKSGVPRPRLALLCRCRCRAERDVWTAVVNVLRMQRDAVIAGQGPRVVPAVTRTSQGDNRFGVCAVRSRCSRSGESSASGPGGRSLCSCWADPRQSGLTDEPLDPPAADVNSLAFQDGMDPGRSVDAAGVLVDLPDPPGQLGVLTDPFSGLLLGLAPAVTGGGGGCAVPAGQTRPQGVDAYRGVRSPGPGRVELCGEKSRGHPQNSFARTQIAQLTTQWGELFLLPGGEQVITLAGVGLPDSVAQGFVMDAEIPGHAADHGIRLGSPVHETHLTFSHPSPHLRGTSKRDGSAITSCGTPWCDSSQLRPSR